LAVHGNNLGTIGERRLLRDVSIDDAPYHDSLFVFADSIWNNRSAQQVRHSRGGPARAGIAIGKKAQRENCPFRRRRRRALR
jgi:hypothetical protein